MDPDVQAAKPDYLPQQRFIEYKKLNDTKEALHLRYPAGPEVLFSCKKTEAGKPACLMRATKF